MGASSGLKINKRMSLVPVGIDGEKTRSTSQEKKTIMPTVAKARLGVLYSTFPF